MADQTLNGLAAGLRQSAQQVQRRTTAAVSKTLVDMEADGKALAPVDTGNLRNSITNTGPLNTGGAIEGQVGPTAEYGVYVELGTSRMRAQPFMGPAADRRIPGFVQAMEQIGFGLVEDATS